MKDGFSRKPSVTFTEEQINFMKRIANDELTKEEQNQLDKKFKQEIIENDISEEEWKKETIRTKSHIDIFDKKE